ncbi:MAG: hypothetical protein MN733_10745, partial [Nitrososphaera sp.]|nr:hypothetical protein [Nitrososphaera sp.]
MTRAIFLVKNSWAKPGGGTVAYRGYLVEETTHGFRISKDGFHIAWSKTLAEAETTIDKLT